MKKKNIVIVICSIVLCSGGIICVMKQLEGPRATSDAITNKKQVEQSQTVDGVKSNTEAEDEEENRMSKIIDGEVTIHYDDTNKKKVEESGVKEFTIENASELTNLQVEDSNSYVTIVKSKEENIKVSIEYNLRVPSKERLDEIKDAIDIDAMKENNTCKLSLKELSNGKSFWSFLDEIKGDRSISLTITVSIPDNFNNVKVDTDTGYIDVSDVNGELDIDTDTGYVYASNITGNLNIDTNTGYVYVSDTAAQMEVSTDTGYIDFTNVEFIGNCKATTETGYIDFKIADTNEKGADITMKSETGDINCNFMKKINNKLNVTMATDTGNIDIGLGDNKVSYETNQKKSMSCTISELCTIKATSQLGEVFVKE